MLRRDTVKDTSAVRRCQRYRPLDPRGDTRETTLMPHLLRLTRDTEARLERLSQQTGLSRTQLIERCLDDGMARLERQLLLEIPDVERAERPIDQLLRESGLGA